MNSLYLIKKRPGQRKFVEFFAFWLLFHSSDSRKLEWTYFNFSSCCFNFLIHFLITLPKCALGSIFLEILPVIDSVMGLCKMIFRYVALEGSSSLVVVLP